jgi:hypothetical protein
MTLYKDTDWGSAAFGAAASRVRAQGDVAVSPVELDICLWGFDSRKQSKLPPIMTRRRVLSFDIGTVVPSCDVIYLLRGWSRSSGARAELAAALTYGLEVELEPGAEAITGVKIRPNGGGDGKGRTRKLRKTNGAGRARKRGARGRRGARVGRRKG